MFTMPLAPLTLNETSGDWMWTAASVLSLRSPKLAFDPSLPKDFDISGGSDDVKNSGLSMLERYVSRLLDASFDDSSLFWHYAMRHVPSQSLVCAKDYTSTNHKPSGTTMPYYNDAGLEQAILSYLPSATNRTESIAMLGYGAFPIGSIPTSCMCGWPKVTSQQPSSFKCQIPANICAVIQKTDCTYDPFTSQGKATLKLILDSWGTYSANQAWECSDVDLSDAWGIVSQPEADSWIASGAGTAGYTQSKVSQLLRAGRSGLRIGNVKTLKSQAKREGVWPSQRVHKLQPDDDPQSTGAAQRRCADTILSSIDAASVAKEVVDDLFPVAQGIHESTPMSFCLRYAIEYSRLRMLRAIQSISRQTSIMQQEIRFQKSVVDRWKGRCESQLNMLGVCKSNGLFELVPGKEFPYDCPFVISNPYNSGKAGYYVTPKGCLLFYKGSFYNPCRMSGKKCTSKTSKLALTLAEITEGSERANTLIKFDVRDAGSGDVVGEWPVTFYDADPKKNDVATQTVERLLRWKATSSSASTPEDAYFESANLGEDATKRGANIPWRLSKRFIEEIFMLGGTHANAKGSIGNTPVSATTGWATAEGLVTDGQAADFCDGIADWWPDVS